MGPRLLLLTCAALLALAGACAKTVAPTGAADGAPAADGTAAGGTALSDESPRNDVTIPRVAADNPGLLFSWLDASRRTKASASLSDVPVDRRERVLVADLSLTPEQRRADRYAFFTDLTAPDADGTYPVVVVSRFNAAKGERLTVKLPPPPPGTVIVYSAVWCGFCKKAKSWLSQNNVPFVERDVEKDPGVSAELKEKLSSASLRSSGVPVIDWDGELIVGFDKRRLTEALAKRDASGD